MPDLDVLVRQLQGESKRRLIPHDMQIYGPESRATDAFHGDISLTGYHFPGDALSSSLVALFSGINATVKFAAWDLVWNPMDALCGVRLISCEDGPTNIQVIEESTGLASVSPHHQTFNITAAMAALVEITGSGVVGDSTFHRQLGHQVKVNTGVAVPIIFSSRIQLILEV